MSKLKTACLSVCIAFSALLVSCSSSKQTTDTKHTARRPVQPKFIDNIALNGGGKTMRTTTLEDRRRKDANGNHQQGGKPTSLQYKYAGMLRVQPQYISNLALYSFIEEWYGVRYRMGGNDKSGIDCSAFVQRLYENVFGTNLVRTAMEQFGSCNMEWNMDRLKEGDLVFFRTHGKRITHVGIYLMNNYFVHASSSQGVVISSLNEDYWSRYYAGAGQVPRDKNRM